MIIGLKSFLVSNTFVVLLLFLLTISFNDNILKVKIISLYDIKEGEKMPRVQLKTLTEQMYYVLLALQHVRCGSEISQYVEELTNQRIKLGPGTLYAILSKFEEEQLIEEVKCEGRKRSYVMTHKGKNMFDEEYQRLLLMIEDTKREYHQ